MLFEPISGFISVTEGWNTGDEFHFWISRKSGTELYCARVRLKNLSPSYLLANGQVLAQFLCSLFAYMGKLNWSRTCSFALRTNGVAERTSTWLHSCVSIRTAYKEEAYCPLPNWAWELHGDCQLAQNHARQNANS